MKKIQVNTEIEVEDDKEVVAFEDKPIYEGEGEESEVQGQHSWNCHPPVYLRHSGG